MSKKNSLLNADEFNLSVNVDTVKKDTKPIKTVLETAVETIKENPIDDAQKENISKDISTKKDTSESKETKKKDNKVSKIDDTTGKSVRLVLDEDSYTYLSFAGSVAGGNMTTYLRDMIKEDMKQHPEVVSLAKQFKKIKK